MQKAFLAVIAVGAAVGLLWPSGQTPAPVAAAAVRTSPGEPQETVLERSENGHFYANVEVNGHLVRFMVDTGATGVALTEKTAERIGIPFSRNEYSEIGKGASGVVRGAFVRLDKLALDGKEARSLDGVVLEGGDMNLLGQGFLGRFSVEMRGDTMRIY